MAGRSFPLSITWQIGNSQAVLSSVNQVQGAFTRLQSSAQTTTTSMQGLAQGVNPLNQSLSGVAQRSQQVVGSQSALGNSFRQTGTAAQGTAGGLGNYNTLLGNTGAQATTTGAKMKGLVSSFGGLAGSVTGAVASSTLLITALGGINDAQIALDQSNLQVQFRMQRTAVRQEHVNRLQRQGKEDTIQYRNAVSQLSLTQNRGAIAIKKNQDAQARYNLAMANFAGQVIPAATVAGTSFMSLIKNLTTANAQGVTVIGRLSGVIGQLPVGFNGATLASKGFGATLRALALNPVFLILTGFAALLTLIATNTFGLRDAFNSAGKALGDWLPFLRPILDGISAIGEAMGITGEQTVQAATESSEELDSLKDRAGDVSKSLEILGKAVENAAKVIGRDLAEQSEFLVEKFAAADEETAKLKEQLLGLKEGTSEAAKGLTEEQKALEISNLEKVIATKETNRFAETEEGLRDIFQNNITQINKNSEVTSGLTGAYELATQASKGLADEQTINAAITKIVQEESAKFDTRLQSLNTTLTESISKNADMDTVIASLAPHVVDVSSAYDQLDPILEKSNQTMLEWIKNGATAEQTGELLAAITSGSLAPAFVNDLEPGLRNSIVAILEWNKDMKESGRQSDVTFDLVNALVGGFLNQADATETSSAALLTNAEAMAAAQDEAQNLITGYENTTKTNRAFLEGLGVTSKALLENEDLVNALANEAKVLGQEIDKDTSAFGFFAIRTQQVNAFIDENGNIIRENVAAYALWKEAIRFTTDGTLDLSATIQELGRINQEQMAKVPQTWDLWLDIVKNGQADVISMKDLVAAMGLEGTQAGDLLVRAAEEHAEATGTATEAVEEELTAIEELSEANAEATTTLREWITAIEDGTFAEEQRTAGMITAAEEQINLAAEILNTRGELEFYTEAGGLATEMQLQFIEGIEGVALQLIEQAGALENARGELEGYVLALESGVPQLLAFKEGQLAADEALLKLALQISHTSGELSRYGQHLAEGRQGTLSFAEGQQEVFRSTLDTISSIANLIGQISALNALFEDGRAQTVAFAEGLVKGTLAASELKVEIAAANGEWIGFREALIAFNPELQKFGDLSGFTNEQIEQMVQTMNGSREAIAALTEELFKGAAALTDWISSVDFREIDDEFEETVDTFREGLEDMIDLARDNGVKITDEFVDALGFQGVIQLAGEQMHELWPILQAGVKAGIKGDLVDASIIDQSVGIFTERIKKALREADVEGEAKAVVDGILTELANLKNIEDPVELIQALANIESKVVALKEGTFGLEQTTTAITSLTQVSPENLVMIAQRISELATATDTLQLTPEQIDEWAQSLSQLTGVPVDQLKAALEQKLQETGESATSAFLEAGPGGDAARAALATQMVKLQEVFVGFQNDVGVVMENIIAFWAAFVTDTGTKASQIADILRSNLDEWGTWANNILTAVDTAGRNATTMATSTSTMHSSISSTLRSNIDSWGRWANNVGTASRAAASSFASAMSSIRSSASSAVSAVNRLRSAIASLRSKTITITTRFRTVGRPPGGLQHGGSFIVDRPTSIAGVQTGEFSKPELVTVTPLTNPNNIQDKSVNINTGSVRRAITEDTSREEGKGRRKNKALVETPIILNLDGEVVLRFIQKRLLEFGDNII